MARQVLENGVILPAEYSDDWYDDMTSNLTKLDDVIGSDSEKLSSSDVGAAALSNNYNDLDNLPTIPTVNDATLTIQKNGVDVQTFTANASSNVTCNITVPTKTSDLTNDSNFVDTSNSAVSSGITSAKVNDYDTHIADTDIHVTTTDKATWNTVTSKANDSDVVHKSGNETVAGYKVFENICLSNSIKAINLENQTIDLNNCYSSFGLPQSGNISFYFCNTNNGIANISNLPEQSAFFLISQSIRILSSGRIYAKQTCITINNTYVRYCKNNIWLSWINVHDDIEPSSLSLPVFPSQSSWIDISSYITDMTGSVANFYTPPANGYITFSATGNQVQIFSDYGLQSKFSIQSGSTIRGYHPVLKNEPKVRVSNFLDLSLVRGMYK